MTSLGHRLCTGSVSKCSEIRIVEEKKMFFRFLERMGQLATLSILALLSMFIMVLDQTLRKLSILIAKMI